LARLLGRTASRGQKIPTRVAVKIVLDTLAGLETAHGLRDEFDSPLNIVHRDVSPQNVMVGVDGTSRITDFGVARAATRLTTTRAGQLKGKLGYMAPEQAQGDEVDLRADVFAVGVILWETLTGRRLFKGKPDAPDAQTLNRLLHEPVPKLRERDPEIPEVFEQVCDRALARNPDERFRSCGEFADALEAVMQQAGGIASTREVAAFVDAVAGPEIEAQREAVRNWVARSEVSVIERADGQAATMPATPSYHTSPFDLASSAKRPLVAGEPQPTKSHVGLIAGGIVALTVAVAVGVVSVFMLSQQADPAPAVTQPPAVTPPASTTAAATPPTPPVETSAPVASASAAPPADTANERPPPQPDTTTTATTKPPERRPPPPDDTRQPDDTVEPPKPPVDESTDDLNTNPYRQ
ncbi:MAG: serine/threonine protein kinase, partial [Myxococcota bacterium]